MLALIPIFAAAVFPPTITKSFSPPTVLVNQVSTMTIVIDNPNTSDLTGASMNDVFPPQLINAGPVTTSCVGAFVALTPPPSTLFFSGTIPANGMIKRERARRGSPGSFENLTGNVFSTGPSSLVGGDAILTVVTSIPTLSPMLLLLLALVLAAVGARLTA